MAGQARGQGPSFCWRAGGGRRVPLDRGQLLQAASGEGHFLLLLSDGAVLASGDNSRGQLGRRGRAREEQPVPISAVKTLQFGLVSCGRDHCLAVARGGRVFAWGACSEGQLGIGEVTASVDIPRTIKSLKGIKIIQVSCGDHHSLALSEGGQLFSWGSNSHGQLGLGEEGPSQAEPRPVKSLQGVPLAQVAAGGAHSFALSLYGTSFGWGSNCAGQLALSGRTVPEQRRKPVAVGALQALGVVFISCGRQHTAVLTQDGKVFTFGDNTYGQLGHGSDTSGPQPVEGLRGPVSQVDCGSKHTLVYVYTTGEVVSFGCGPSHTSNPAPAEALAENADTSCLISAAEPVNVKHIFAGTYANFVTTDQGKRTSIPEKTLKTLPEISRINKSLIEKWISATSSKKKGVESEIETIFSSPACLTASFLNERKPGESVSIGVDLKRARDTFKRLAENKKISSRITSSLEKLVQDLPHHSQHQEALLVFLLLPECPVMREPSNWATLIVPFAKAVHNMHPKSWSILQQWWKSLPASALNTLVLMFKSAFVCQLRDWTWHPQNLCNSKALLETMKKVYKVNKEAACQLPESTFCISQLQGRLDFLLKDRQNVFLREQHKLEGVDSLIFSDYPFIFDLDSKIKLWQADCCLKMKVAEFQSLQENLVFPMLALPSNLVLNVQKSDLVEDALRQLKCAAVTDLQKQLVVGFRGETRPKYGGVVSEFFKAVFEKMTGSNYGMFMYPEEGSCMWFPANPVMEKERYYFFGVLCGLSLYNANVVYIPFPLALFKKLLGQKPSLEDLKELSPVLGRNLQEVLNHKADSTEDLDLYFNVYWDQNDVDLIPDGLSTRVDQTRKGEYVSECVNYIFNTSVKEVYEEFQKGFYRVCDESLIKRLFKPEELRQAVIGNADYDWEQFEKNSVFEGYSSSHPVIKMFWEVFHELSLEEKKKFLFFLTGNDRLQVRGMRNIGIIFRSPELLCESDNMRSLICHHVLDLPKYSTKERMKEALLVAINNNTGFDPAVI